MNYEQYKMLKELLEIKRQEAVEEDKKYKEIIENKINEIVNIEGVKVVGVGDYLAYGWSVTVASVDENGEKIFGADITVYYKNDTNFDGTEDKGVEINHGTCGAFTKDDTALILRAQALAKLTQSFNELEELFDGLDRDKAKAFYEADRLTDRAKWDLIDEYEGQLERKLAVDNEYTDKYDRTLKITHITPKFVHYTEGDRPEKKERKSDFLSKQARLKFERLEEQDKQKEQEQ